MDEDRKFMKLALRLARKGLGSTHPNPMVGALVVRDGKVVGRGWHRRPGEPHAEVVALREAGDSARGATMYVTLEPCVHYGRTPPCVDRILEAGVSRVICATVDPNPLVDGRGIGKLRDAGVEVEVGVLEDEAKELNRAYFKYITTGRPFVTLKWAQTLDGRIATSSGDSRWITGEGARKHAHRLRAEADAVVVGVGTVLADDPQLTVRLTKGRDPLRVVLDSELRTPPTAKVLSGGRAVLATTERASPERRKVLEEAGAEVWVLPERDGRVDLEALLAKLAGEGRISVLVEGGREVLTSFLRRGMCDRIVIFLAPKLLGEGIDALGDLGIDRISDALSLRILRTRRFGEDICLEADICSLG
ncbi:MAG: bifunctional diaminohydroxyphosphoribosylaminopyrimidine deaminase/5-amino-6-(5-phosphoribosylamino)uracil reductase RibD [Candidatus Latescibacterota bacterium]|nr:MAG: bifunctional diaminohydroxyphosphoribosylaminopyrimidine deaminase/5-amino-6-(5-phosphoribosylamino)uracil reductase RibD [Candidatus Latescibacterota bacterium]RKY72854.1 MAG: bifunctional diaminohydroxyphosphoribosylaminopyrimidine deaminase/5-amino-6-(5-phosphoribosylamino)uracil reductase RibD [Candidatus Latescibacterota bacterium]